MGTVPHCKFEAISGNVSLKLFFLWLLVQALEHSTLTLVTYQLATGYARTNFLTKIKVKILSFFPTIFHISYFIIGLHILVTVASLVYS